MGRVGQIRVAVVGAVVAIDPVSAIGARSTAVATTARTTAATLGGRGLLTRAVVARGIGGRTGLSLS